jgi:DNA gyrase subunit A
VEGFLKLADKEIICSLVTFKDFTAKEFILIATQKGQVVRIATEAFKNARLSGVNAIDIAEGDLVVNATWTNGKSEVIGFTVGGYGIRFDETQIRETGRGVKGVGAMDLSRKDENGKKTHEDQLLTILSLSNGEKEVMVLSAHGYAKRMNKDEISQIKRNGKGVRCYRADAKTGQLVGALALKEGEDIMCVTAQGKTLKTEAKEVALQSRGARGVMLLKLDAGDRIVSCATAAQTEVE